MKRCCLLMALLLVTAAVSNAEVIQPAHRSLIGMFRSTETMVHDTVSTAANKDSIIIPMPENALPPGFSIQGVALAGAAESLHVEILPLILESDYTLAGGPWLAMPWRLTSTSTSTGWLDYADNTVYYSLMPDAIPPCDALLVRVTTGYVTHTCDYILRWYWIGQ